MDTLGLYDIDLWHTVQNHYPNLELMHYYSYYLRAGQRPILLEKNSKQFYNKIIYFKDNPNFIPPMGIQLSGDNIQINGYGFFKNENYIPEDILKTPIDYTPYDAFSDRLKDYDVLRKSALIRISNGDLLELSEKAKAKKVFIIDREVINNKKVLDFLSNHKQYTYYFPHKLIFYDYQDYITYKSLKIKTRNYFIIRFQYNADFIKETNFREDTFIMEMWKNEDKVKYMTRLVKTFLLSLYYEIPMKMHFDTWDEDISSLYNWYYRTEKDQSYYEYCKNKGMQLIQNFNTVSSELRILLKTKPKNINTKNIDF